MKNLLAVLLLLPWVLYSQERAAISIHQEQSEYYSRFSEQDIAFFDSLNNISHGYQRLLSDTCQLNKLIFGFHPYWMGSAYLNYRWGLLTDLCYFSYEVDPNTGDPVTLHGWLTDPSVDSAQANGVRTHLCATLFSGHYSFFGNTTVQQNLITNLVSLVQQRNADGLNVDFEAVPAALSDELTSFIIDLSGQFHAAVPGGILSIDIPAVDWSDVFDIEGMKNHVDLFFVMGYDYYWNGSGTAGPVGPVYSMTDVYDYSLCRTISAYQNKGLPDDKFILGLPYYGRLWKTQSNSVPSGTIGYGTALTYANVRNNAGGNFSQENYFWEGNSFSSCYIYYENSDWNQCFIGLERDLKKRYDLVNYRGLAGIGIWALGYDDGYQELWEAIENKFTDCAEIVRADTLYDSGGPSWDYYNLEDYSYTVIPGDGTTRYLEFNSFNTEAGFDSLWIYSGTDTLTLLGVYSGTDIPPLFHSDDGSFTLCFHSDGLTTGTGWTAIWHDGTLGLREDNHTVVSLYAYPNPFFDLVNIRINQRVSGALSIICIDGSGRRIPISIEDIVTGDNGEAIIKLKFPIATLYGYGIYFLEIRDANRKIGSVKLVSGR